MVDVKERQSRYADSSQARYLRRDVIAKTVSQKIRIIRLELDWNYKPDVKALCEFFSGALSEKGRHRQNINGLRTGLPHERSIPKVRHSSAGNVHRDFCNNDACAFC